MKIKIVFFSFLIFIIFCGCNVTKKTQQNSSQVELKYISHSINKYRLDLKMEIINHSTDTVSILKPRPIKLGSFVASAVPPDFFEIKFLNQESECIISEPSNSGTRHIKNMRDILYVPPNSRLPISINCEHYGYYHCGEKQLDVLVKYKFNEQYLDKEYFEKRVTKLGRLNAAKTNELYNAISKTYQKELSINISIE